MLKISNSLVCCQCEFSWSDCFKEKREKPNVVIQESQIVHMVNDIKVISVWVLKEDRSPVIVVVGMGGHGKTLLPRHIFNSEEVLIFNSEEVRKHFSCQLWLAVCKNFSIRELIYHLVRQFDANQNLKDVMELSEKIDKHLEQKCCQFAVDHVWHRDAWNGIGSSSRIQDKVVVTTGHETVANALGAGEQIFFKSSLSEENSWQLFCIHAFPDDAHYCLKALDKIAHQVVNKCGGLPLVIKTIGAYLARSVRGLPNDWE